MTREEAIFCEKSYIGETDCADCKYYGTDTCESRESHKMAIKALEQEPCEDAISRRAAYEIVDNMLMGERNHKSKALDEIKFLPSVMPVPKLGTQEESESCKGCPNICVMYDLNMKSCKDKMEGVEE